MCDGKQAVVVIKPAQRKRDGRVAYLNLYQHYLGTNAVNDLVTSTEAKLDSYEYEGEGRKANFEKCVTFQRRQHNILHDLVRHGYRGLDERSKVRILNKNIETDTVQAVKTQILADENLQVDYDRCAGLYKSFISQMRSSQPKESFNISNTATKGDEKIEDRYYTKDEYRKLSESKKLKLWELRKSHGATKRPKSEQIVSKKQYDTLARNLAALEGGNAEASDNEETKEEDKENSKANGNRSNPALTKQKTKAKE